MARKKNAKVTDVQLTKPQTRLERYLGTIAGLFSDAPTDPRTRLERYLDAIVQGGGGGGGGGGVAYAAIGSVLYHAGATPPAGYLACDGTIYNITEYPELAQFFADNYGTANYWGGNGTTTFAVPDWRGEFFRASGQNSRENQGSGAAVGTHQDATEHLIVRGAYSTGVGNMQGDSVTDWLGQRKQDSVISVPTHTWINLSANGKGESATDPTWYTSRPSNTSLLVCIKAKMVDNMAELVAAVVQQMRSQLEPVGKVIYYAGLVAPANYLACDGTVYNIADYPELAQFFADNYGSANYWGGDGTTTFAVPDWRGEFFRASGTNSHANQGSGAAVGAHQDATENPAVFCFGNKWFGTRVVGTSGDTFTAFYRNADSSVGMDGYVQNSAESSFRFTAETGSPGRYMPRPTNTSLLVCIKA